VPVGCAEGQSGSDSEAAGPARSRRSREARHPRPPPVLLLFLHTHALARSATRSLTTRPPPHSHVRQARAAHQGRQARRRGEPALSLAPSPGLVPTRSRRPSAAAPLPALHEADPPRQHSQMDGDEMTRIMYALALSVPGTRPCRGIADPAPLHLARLAAGTRSRRTSSSRSSTSTSSTTTSASSTATRPTTR